METEIAKIITALGTLGRTANVMEVLNYTQADFDGAFRIALEMENRNLVKLLYSNINQNKVIVEITLVGEAAYEKTIQNQ
jgi:hypothetical protein